MATQLIKFKTAVHGQDSDGTDFGMTGLEIADGEFVCYLSAMQRRKFMAHLQIPWEHVPELIEALKNAQSTRK